MSEYLCGYGKCGMDPPAKATRFVLYYFSSKWKCFGYREMVGAFCEECYRRLTNSLELRSLTDWTEITSGEYEVGRVMLD